ncbi:MAG: TRAP transporter substrate-binding protein [Pseudomonadota bacterium]|nr:TRAP transporter substrate-binding protein [Pseudomonadota bacterium]MEE2859686.1 TRAP transporter substrate-binding protein [Pseudomonadota bacterium]
MKVTKYAAALGLLATTMQPAAAETIALKYATWEPPQAFMVTDLYEPWVADIVAASNGTLEIEMFAGGSLGGPAQQLQNIEGGVSDLGIIVPSQNPGRFPLNEVGELPFLWGDPEVASVAINTMIENGDLEYPGFKVLAGFMTGAYQIHSAKPIESPRDIGRQKLRVAGQVFGKVAGALGANPVGMLTGQVPESISRGAIDGTIQDWSILHAFRISDVTPYHYDYPLGGVVVLMGMNQDVYDSLPADAKAAVDMYSGEAFSRRWAQAVKTETARVKEELGSREDHVIVTPTPEDKAELDEILSGVVEAWGNQDDDHAAVLAAYKEALAAASAE